MRRFHQRLFAVFVATHGGLCVSAPRATAECAGWSTQPVVFLLKPPPQSVLSKYQGYAQFTVHEYGEADLVLPGFYSAAGLRLVRD